MHTRRIVLLLSALFSFPCFAEPENDLAILNMEKQLQRLNTVNFHPNLLPLILKNSDFIGLSPRQIASFKSWGKTNFRPMVATMNEIIRKRIEFQEAALTPSISADALRRQQEDIFELHRKLLDYKLSCRKKIVETFYEETWEGFLMVLGEEGYPIPGATGFTDFAAFGKAD